MCGICGMIGETGDREQVLGRMMRAIRHRGPDESDSYLSGEAALGFQRLSIIDLNTGTQPMRNEDGSKILVFNGEIYNYPHLKEDLIQKGHVFRSTADSEVLLHGYEEYGTGLLDKLRGMFAFAIWDEEKQELFAARDFFGIKPFYYTEVDNVLVFASEIKSILEYPGYQRRVNEEALEQYLSFQYSVLPESFFKGIYQLQPGHYLTYKDHNLQLVQYFKPTLDPAGSGDEAALVKELDQVLKESIDRHLISDVKVASYLSGGVDSNFIATRSGVDDTFTVGFEKEGQLYDETTKAKELTDILKIGNHCKYISKKEFTEAIPDVIYALEEPFGDSSAVAIYFLAQEASKEVKVVLSGEGSDELFGGYNIYLEPLSLRYIQWLPAGLRRGIAALAKKLPRHLKGRSYLIRASQSLQDRYIGNAYIFHQEEKAQLLKKGLKKQPKELVKGDYQEMKHLKDSDQMQNLDLRYWLPGDILRKTDRLSMAHSLEVRVPFLDVDVYNVARKLPTNMKFRPKVTKYLFRNVTTSYLPHQISVRRKLGFPIPIRNWIKDDDWYKSIRKMFEGETAAEYFHTDYILRLLEEHRRGTDDHSRKIWVIYTFLVWHKLYFEEQQARG